MSLALSRMSVFLSSLWSTLMLFVGVLRKSPDLGRLIRFLLKISKILGALPTSPRAFCPLYRALAPLYGGLTQAPGSSLGAARTAPGAFPPLCGGRQKLLGMTAAALCCVLFLQEPPKTPLRSFLLLLPWVLHAPLSTYGSLQGMAYTPSYALYRPCQVCLMLPTRRRGTPRLLEDRKGLAP